MFTFESMRREIFAFWGIFMFLGLVFAKGSSRDLKEIEKNHEEISQEIDLSNSLSAHRIYEVIATSSSFSSEYSSRIDFQFPQKHSTLKPLIFSGCLLVKTQYFKNFNYHPGQDLLKRLIFPFHSFW